MKGRENKEPRMTTGGPWTKVVTLAKKKKEPQNHINKTHMILNEG